MPVAECAALPPEGDPDAEEGDLAPEAAEAAATLCRSPAADVLKNFYHTKRVGNYLIGRKLGEGSFAKVREGLHALTGEKVPPASYFDP
ncbi:hormonally up-regulated neu tumor-associated kinase homolog [Hippocampus comes]|uniref:hormonally up-regulated neu tumor-associated kinase homolog n=1 Tax=Hippocampus comes TaxID=109280 RepID=UPI00094EF3A1|nr:PREDICTED: hormonally up-regulated neu tumor-associated kinase homolog [Hippocampus comes]